MTFRGQDVLIAVSQRADIHMYLLFEKYSGARLGKHAIMLLFQLVLKIKRCESTLHFEKMPFVFLLYL